jgi:WD40 repeat protein
VAFSPDGKVLASVSYDQTIKLWDTATGVTLQMLDSHSGSTTAVAFSPDGKVLASASDKTVAVAFSPDRMFSFSSRFKPSLEDWQRPLS